MRSTFSGGQAHPGFSKKMGFFPAVPKLQWESVEGNVRKFHPIQSNQELPLAVDSDDNVLGIWFSGTIMKIFDEDFNRMTMNRKTRVPKPYTSVFMQNSNNSRN